MKKVILILILFTAIPIFAQNYDSLGRLEVAVPTVNTKNLYDFATFNRENYDTVGTSPDTLSRQLCSVDTCNSMYSLGITIGYAYVLATTDTIIYSPLITFPSWNTGLLLPSESKTNPKIIYSIAPNLYYKVKFTGGHTGTAVVRKWAWGF
jgi:hypothetical protein